MNGTVPRCAFWVRQQPLRTTSPMVIKKEQQSHNEVCLGRPGFGVPIGSNVGIGPRLPASALGRQVPVETEKHLSMHPPLRGKVGERLVSPVLP